VPFTLKGSFEKTARTQTDATFAVSCILCGSALKFSSLS